MKEVKIVAWCDHEEHEFVDTPAEATNTFKVAVDDGYPREIDLCDEHVTPFIEVFTVLEERGTTITGAAKKPGPKSPGVKKGGRKHENLPNPPCPDCGQQYTSRESLGSHARDQHGKTLAELLPVHQLSISDRNRLERKAAAEKAVETQAS